jgi:hypothetical protein
MPLCFSQPLRQACLERVTPNPLRKTRVTVAAVKALLVVQQSCSQARRYFTLLVDHATGIGSAEAQATVRYYARARRGDSGSPYSAESYAENRTPVHDTTVADGPARIVSRTAPSTLATDSPQEPPPPSSPWATDKEVSATFPKPSLLVGCSAAAKCQATRRAHQLKCTRA